MTYDFIMGLLNNDDSVYGMFNAVKTETWPEEADIFEILHELCDCLKDEVEPDGFNAWLFIDKENGSIIGDGGFKGAPNQDGEIDIGYAILASSRRKGYGFEAVSALIDWAMRQKHVKTITADCLADNTPSIALLNKVGMREIKRREGLVYFHITKDFN